MTPHEMVRQLRYIATRTNGWRIQSLTDIANQLEKLMGQDINVIATLRADLEVAAQTLRRYEQHHRAKGTPESLEKAQVNADLAARFEVTLAGTGSLPDSAERLRVALRFYANGEHFMGTDEWDTVSGEPQNWLCHGEAMLEDGTIAARALRGEAIKWGDDEGDGEPPQPIEGEKP